MSTWSLWVPKVKIDLDPNLSDSIFLNFFSSITIRPIEAKFHVEPPWDRRTKACLNGPGNIIMVTWQRWPPCPYMVTPLKIFFSLNGPGNIITVSWQRWPPCPYMVKPLKIFFSGTDRPITLKLSIQRWVLGYYQVCSNDGPGLTVTYFTARSNLVPYAFEWEKIKQWIFQKLL